MQHANHEYDDDCEGCQPALMDIKTGKLMKKDNPIMIAVIKAWKEKTTLIERRATSRVWTGQSTNPIDVGIMERVGKLIEKAIKEAEE